jgi:hypothetical protein
MRFSRSLVAVFCFGTVAFSIIAQVTSYSTLIVEKKESSQTKFSVGLDFAKINSPLVSCTVATK